MRVLLLFLFALHAWPQQPTPTPEQLSPAEAFASALAPFNAARAQPDDLTEADTIALGVGAEHAGRDCISLQPRMEEWAAQPAQLIGLARLCIFGRQYEAARTAAVRYLALLDPPERELALLLLVRALLGLKAPGSAEPQLQSLLRDYPYDAQIHFAADQVIDATEDAGESLNRLALKLCGMENAATLPLLAAGKALPGKDASASGGILFADAVRCATLAKQSGDIAEVPLMNQLRAVVAGPAWQGTADYAGMREALYRAEMVGKPVPLPAMEGRRIPAAGAPTPVTVRLGQGTVVLIPFTLWSPSAASILRSLALSLPGQTLYAVTSWAANTGEADTPSPAVLAALRTRQQGLPPRVRVLLVPDSTLQTLHADAFPSAIVLRNGTVAANQPLAGEGSIRSLLVSLPANH